MDFNFTEEQEMLKRAARDFLTAECPMSMVKMMENDEKGYPTQLYDKMASLGWMGLPFPVEYGGEGGSFLDLIILLEEMGRVCLPGPFFSSTVLGGISILEGGTEERRKEFLPKIARGEAFFTLALNEEDARYSPMAIQTKAIEGKNGYIIDGKKLFITDAHVADYIVCVCRTGSGEQDINPFVVSAKESNVGLTSLQTMAGDKQFEILFNRVVVPRRNMLGEPKKGWPLMESVLQKATLAKCAEMLGGAQKVLEMVVDHAKQRIQFGHPIGTFEAVQHYCADMLIGVDGARYITYLAGWKLSNGLPCRLEISTAKTWVNQAYEYATLIGGRIIAGVGYILDHDLPVYFKRAKQAQAFFGTSDFHREIVAQELGM